MNHELLSGVEQAIVQAEEHGQEHSQQSDAENGTWLQPHRHLWLLYDCQIAQFVDGRYLGFQVLTIDQVNLAVERDALVCHAREPDILWTAGWQTFLLMRQGRANELAQASFELATVESLNGRADKQQTLQERTLYGRCCHNFR